MSFLRSNSRLFILGLCCLSVLLTAGRCFNSSQEPNEPASSVPEDGAIPADAIQGGGAADMNQDAIGDGPADINMPADDANNGLGDPAGSGDAPPDEEDPY